MKTLSFIAKEVLDRPLLCERSYLDTVIHFLGPRIGVDNSSMNAGQYNTRQPNAQSHGGVAVVPVIGSLTHRGGSLDAESGMRSYQAISAELDAACSDNTIHTIVMEYDTPGGSVSGAFELADKINAIADDPEKPRIVAFINGMAASAGYLLASQSNAILATRNSSAGSIGVVTAHQDVSQALEDQGVVVTYIYAGDHKVDGNPTEPLSEEVLGRVQARIDESYVMFLDAVERGRGEDFTAKDAKATKADTYLAPEAVDLGLVDAVISEDQIMATVNAMAGNLSNEGFSMSKEAMFTQAQVDAMVSEKLAEAAAASSNAVSDAASVERTRISAIMGLDLYKGREAAAQKCIDMGMSAKDSEEFLSAVPVSNDTKAENNPAPAGDAQKKVMEQLAAESPDVKPSASIATGGSELSEQQKFEQDAIASAKSFGAVKGRRRNS